VVEEDVPDAVADLLESDVVSVECLGKKLLFGMESEGAGVADATDLDVAWILRRSDSFGVWAQ